MSAAWTWRCDAPHPDDEDRLVPIGEECPACGQGRARGFDWLHPWFSLSYRCIFGEWPVRKFWAHERPGAYTVARIVCFIFGCDAEPGGDCKRCWS